ncbi:MAG: hypothetical protein Q7R65_01410 [bacterium]|nr:hypothetical protein [bacterium]
MNQEKQLEVIRCSGCDITKDGERIVQVLFGIAGIGRKIRLGDRVYSNGRIFAPKGTLGIVVGLHMPGESGHTSNIIQVWFEGFSGTRDMKTKDLQFET